VYSVSIGESQVVGGEPFSALISDLPIGQEYFVRIAAVNSRGFSSFTDSDGLIGAGARLSATVA